MKVVNVCRKGRSEALAGEVRPSSAVPERVARTTAPLRASEAHDCRVRRITAVTPDMACPRAHDITARRSPTARESTDNIAKRSEPVRVQTVNVNRGAKKSGMSRCQKRIWRFFQAEIA